LGTGILIASAGAVEAVNAATVATTKPKVLVSIVDSPPTTDMKIAFRRCPLCQRADLSRQPENAQKFLENATFLED
jgi:hypothetical protein